jgi:hypothetical protein
LPLGVKWKGCDTEFDKPFIDPARTPWGIFITMVTFVNMLTVQVIFATIRLL